MLERQFSTNKIFLDELVKGKEDTRLMMHNTAMISLVAERDAIKQDSCPETLLFDISRIQMFQHRFKSFVNSSGALCRLMHQHPEAVPVVGEVLVAQNAFWNDQTCAKVKDALTGDVEKIMSSCIAIKDMDRDPVHILL